MVIVVAYYRERDRRNPDNRHDMRHFLQYHAMPSSVETVDLFDLLTSEAYRCCVRLTCPPRLKLAWLSDG